MANCLCVKMSDEIRLSGGTVFRGRIMTVEEDSVLLPSGRTSTRETVRTADSVSAGILDDQGRICLVRQYRYSVGKHLWEIPAGRIEPNENPEDAVVREAGEETGLSCVIVQRIAGFFLAAGFATEYMHMYLLKAVGASCAEPDEDESIEAAFFDEEELKLMLSEGSLEDSKSLVFLNWYLRSHP